MYLLESTGMLTNKAPSRRKLSMKLQETLVATILIVFLLLHVTAGAVLKRAGAVDGPSLKQDLTSQPYD
jgi:hypothetical protein